MNTENKNKGIENLPQTDPPDFVWEKIEEKLDEKKKRRVIPVWTWYATGIAACLVIALTVVLQREETIRRTPYVHHTAAPKSDDHIATDEAKQPEKETLRYQAGSYAQTDSIRMAAGTTTYHWTFGNVEEDVNSSQNGYAQSGAYSLSAGDEYDATNNMNDYGLVAPAYEREKKETAKPDFKGLKAKKDFDNDGIPDDKTIYYEVEPNTGESYASLIENEYVSPLKEPLSTFSIDVDGASYSNTRRMLNSGYKPPKDAVRIEEFINYFDYNYANPKGEDPFSINLETASCPWNKETRVVMIGLHGKEMPKDHMPASNLVFLIDVSGSMQDENKLPLVKQSLKLLVDEMRPQDRIAIVTYAGAAGLALPSTLCSEKEQIKKTIEHLEAGGSTAGGEGITLAYKIAKENKVTNGNNRIILVTDGDFNVGPSSDQDMESLIKEKSKDGIFLTACGFGMGNYKDSKMEILADKGNGNYYYIDNFKESKKIFSTGLTGTLFTIAKDVKIQVEFNPKFVKAYRLIGYENRRMPPQDFHDDTKDAGELGAGHTVTALYEIIPAGSNVQIPGFTELKYQSSSEKPNLNDFGNELLTVKLRYKKPDEDKSKLLEKTLANNTQSYTQASDNFRYACGVSVFGMLLRDSKFKADATYELAKTLLKSANLNVSSGYRDELLQLIEKASHSR